MRQTKRQISFLVAVSVVIGALVFGAYTVFSSNGAVDLTKQEALQLMNYRTAAVMAQADLNEFVQQLYLKYGVSTETHSLNVETGAFVPKPVEQENEKATPTD